MRHGRDQRLGPAADARCRLHAPAQPLKLVLWAAGRCYAPFCPERLECQASTPDNISCSASLATKRRFRSHPMPASPHHQQKRERSSPSSRPRSRRHKRTAARTPARHFLTGQGLGCTRLCGFPCRYCACAWAVRHAAMPVHAVSGHIRTGPLLASDCCSGWSAWTAAQLAARAGERTQDGAEHCFKYLSAHMQTLLRCISHHQSRAALSLQLAKPPIGKTQFSTRLQS